MFTEGSGAWIGIHLRPGQVFTEGSGADHRVQHEVAFDPGVQVAAAPTIRRVPEQQRRRGAEQTRGHLDVQPTQAREHQDDAVHAVHQHAVAVEPVAAGGQRVAAGGQRVAAGGQRVAAGAGRRVEAQTTAVISTV